MKTLFEKQRPPRLARAAIASAVLAALAGPEALASGMPSSFEHSGTAYTLQNQDTLKKTGYYWDAARESLIAVTFADESWSPNTAKVKALATDSASNYISGSVNATATGGSHGTSTGSHSSVTGGKYNNASGDRATVSGGEANTASGNYASVAGGKSNAALGKHASVSGGRGNISSGNYSAASGGYGNTASGESSLAAGGSTNEASGKYASAFGGHGSAVLGASSTGVAGGSTGADASYALAAGHQSVAAAERSAAVGFQATASEAGTVSFGHDAGDVSGYKKDADGNWTAATYSSSAYNRLVKVGYGTDGHDAATMAQLPEVALAENESNLTLAKTTDSATGKNSYALALSSSLSGLASVAVGSQAEKAGFTASGTSLAADYGTSGLSLSQNGFAAKTSGALLAVTASGAQMNTGDSGFFATSGQAKITGGGSSVTVTDAGVSVGGATVTNVAAGTVSSASTEAVNGSQLWSVSQSVAALSGKKITFRGNAGSETTALGDAFSILGDGTNITSEVSENQVLLKLRDELAVTTSVTVGGSAVINGNGFYIGGNSGSSLTQSALTVAGKAYITSDGISANGRKITGVADGSVAEGSTDAVNGGQLHAVEAKVDGLSKGKIEFRDSEGNSVKAGLGDTVAIEGADANITTAAADGKIQLKLSDSLDIGQSVKVGGDGGVLLDKDGVSYGGKTYIGKDGLNANGDKISNVADGQVAEGSTDAVNGGQLWETNQKIDKVAETAGNAVTWDKDSGQFTDGKTGTVIEKVKIAGSTISADGIDVNGKVTNVADGKVAQGSKDAVNGGQLYDAARNAVSGIEGDGKYIEASFTQSDAGKAYAVSFTESSRKAIDNANKHLTSDGINANSQKITNVAAGSLSAASTDAVNGSQLYATNQQVEANAGSITKLWKKTGDLNRKINRTGANAAALAALHPLDFDEDHKVSASAGIGQYHGTGALAVGVFVRPTENLMVSLGGSFASEDRMMNAGLSYRFGDSGSAKPVSKAGMAAKVTALTTKNRDLTAQLASTSAKLEAASGRLEATDAELKRATAKIEALSAEIEAIKAMLRK